MIALAALTVGCTDSGLPEQFKPSLESHFLEVANTEFSFGSSASSKQTSISSTQNWEFNGFDSWVKLTPSSGNGSASVDVSVLENMSGDESRLSIFKLTSSDAGWEFSKTINVAQSAAVPYINLSDVNVTLSGAAQTRRVDVAANTKWTASCDSDWLTVTKATDQTYVDLTLSENLTNKSRTAVVTLKGSTTVVINVTQNIAKITSETKELSFAQSGGAYSIEITSETAWTASTTSDWSDITPTSGAAGKTTVVVSAVSNPTMSTRSAAVDLIVGGASVVSIPISQEAIVLSAPQDVSFRALGETKDIEVTSNISWIVLSHPNWISFDKMTGKGNLTLKATATDNANSTSRSGSVVIGVDGLSFKATVSVSQDAKSLSLGASVLQFSDKASTKNFAVITNGKWKASSLDSWMRLSPNSGTGDGEVGVSVTENIGTSERTGKVDVVVNKLLSSVSIIQEGKYCVVDASQQVFSSKGGTLTVKCSTNDKWTARMINASSWVTLSQTSGEADAIIKLSAADNPSVNSRVDTLLITPEYSQAVKVIVRQAPRYLTVDANGLEFFSKGGTASPVIISTDGTYNVTSSSSWLTSSLNGDALTVSAARNTEEKIRYGEIAIKLTDLKEGEMSLTINVIQYATDGIFGREDFGDDTAWDDRYNSTFNINFGGYGSDGSWDDKGGHTLVISIVGYSEDKNWDAYNNGGITVTRVGYKDDQNWDSNTGNGNFGRDDFGGDSNYDDDKAEEK